MNNQPYFKKKDVSCFLELATCKCYINAHRVKDCSSQKQWSIYSCLFMPGFSGLQIIHAPLSSLYSIYTHKKNSRTARRTVMKFVPEEFCQTKIFKPFQYLLRLDNYSSHFTRRPQAFLHDSYILAC